MNDKIIYLCQGILMVVIIIFVARVNEYNSLSGCWAAPADFCAEADITVLFLYIAPGFMARRGYILMKSGDGFILNNPIELMIIPKFETIFSSVFAAPNSPRKYSLKINWLGDESADKYADELNKIFPCEQDVFYYPGSGKLILDHENVLQALLYKDGPASDVALGARRDS